MRNPTRPGAWIPTRIRQSYISGDAPWPGFCTVQILLKGLSPIELHQERPFSLDPGPSSTSALPGPKVRKEAMSARVPLPSFPPLASTICVTALRPCHSILCIQCLSSSGQLNKHSNKGPGKVLWQPEDRAIKPNGCRLLSSLPCARDCAKRFTFIPLKPQWSHELASIATFISHRQTRRLREHQQHPRWLLPL